MKYNKSDDGSGASHHCTRACPFLGEVGECLVERKPAPLGALCEPWALDVIKAALKFAAAVEGDDKLKLVVKDIPTAGELIEALKEEDDGQG